MTAQRKQDAKDKKIAQLEARLRKSEDDKFLYAQTALPGVGEGKGMTPMQYRYAMLRANTPVTDEFTNAWCAERAGYSKADAKQAAYKLEQHPLVRQIIDRARATQIEELKLDGARVLGDLMTIADRSIGRVPVLKTIVPDDGEPMDVLVYENDTSAAIRSNELLGKHLKLWTDKKEVEHTGNVGLQGILDELDGETTGLPEG